MQSVHFFRNCENYLQCAEATVQQFAVNAVDDVRRPPHCCRHCSVRISDLIRATAPFFVPVRVSSLVWGLRQAWIISGTTSHSGDLLVRSPLALKGWVPDTAKLERRGKRSSQCATIASKT